MFRLSRPVIPNRDAAAHQGVARRCQGCRQIWNYCLFIGVLLYKVPPSYPFLNNRGAAKFFKGLKGAANQKRQKNTGLGKRAVLTKLGSNIRKKEIRCQTDQQEIKVPLFYDRRFTPKIDLCMVNWIPHFFQFQCDLRGPR